MDRRRRLAIALALAAAAVTLYLPVLGHEFVNYDDDHYITDNPALRLGLSRAGIAWAFTATHGANWFPLTWLSWLLDYEVHGLDPEGFHLTNLLLHALSAALLFLVLARMTGAPGRSAFVAGVLALHPLHVESVAWAAERKDVLSGLFWVLTMGAYARYVERPSAGRYLMVALCLALGLMAKPMLVTLPLVLLLLDFWPLGRLRSEDGRLDHARVAPLLLEKAPLLALAALSSVVTVLVQRSAGAVQTFERYSLGTRVANALVAYVRYIRKALWPADLAVYYPQPGDALPAWPAVLAGLALAGISFVAVRAWRRRPYLAVGWFWFLGTMVPVIGLVQVGEQAMADRYAYLPLIGLSIAVAWSVAEAAPLRRRPAAGATLAVAALVLLAATASAQVRVWHDSVTLFEHALRLTRENAVAHLNLGAALLNRGQLDEATRHLAEAVRIHPASAEGHGALGEALGRQGRTDEAIEHLRTALRLEPRLGRTHNSLGKALADRGELDQALVHFREAVALDPANAEAHNNLGGGLARQGKFAEAILSFREAVALRPDFAEAHGNWAVALLSRGEAAEAIEHFQVAAARRPDDAEARNGWGLALAGQEAFDAAAVQFHEAVTLDPGDAGYRYNLGLALSRIGKLDEAVEHFQVAATLAPDRAEAHFGGGAALAGLGRFEEAIEHYRRAVELQPDYAQAFNNWGIALASLRRFPEADRRFRRALALRPDYAEAHNNWGLALARQGRFEDAIAHLRAAVSLEPAYAEGRNNLGVYLAQGGRLDEAIEQFQKALELEPGHPSAGANLQKTLAAQRKAKPSLR